MNLQRYFTSRASVVLMTGGRGGNDQQAAAAVELELAVLDCLIYKNRSQHRGTKYFSLLLEVKRTSKVFAAPKIPNLLAEELKILPCIPGKRNGRAREAWVRDVSFKLRRSRSAVVACAAALEAIVKVSRHLAHQVSQTYFVALSVTLLACISRIFSCSLHLGGRLLGVHGALLRSMLALPCTSDYLPASVLAACRLPEEEVYFLELLRRAGGGSSGSRKLGSSSAPAAMSDSLATISPSSTVIHGEQKNLTRSRGDYVGETGDPGAMGNVKSDDDDISERVDHKVTMSDHEAELICRANFLPKPGVDAVTSSSRERDTGTWTRMNMETWADVGASDRFSTVQTWSGLGMSSSHGGRFLPKARQRSMTPRKKLVLAADFSDSSSDEDGDEDKSNRPPTSKPESVDSTLAKKPQLKRSSDPSEIKSSLLSKQSLNLQDLQGSNGASIARPSSPGSNGNDRKFNSKGVPTDDHTRTPVAPSGALADVLSDVGPVSSLLSDAVDGLSKAKSSSGRPLGEVVEDQIPEMALRRCKPESARTGEAKEGATSRVDVATDSKESYHVEGAESATPITSHPRIRSDGGKDSMMEPQVTPTPLATSSPYATVGSIPDEHATPPAETGAMMTPSHRTCDGELVTSPRDDTEHDAGASSVKLRGKQNSHKKDAGGVKRKPSDKARSDKKKKRKGAKKSKGKAKSLSVIENIFRSF